MKKQQRTADLMLFAVVTCWGFSFLLTDIATTELETFILSAYRFIIAFVVGELCLNGRLRKICGETVKWSVILGFILALMYAFMNLGVRYTTLSNSGFLCQTTVIVTSFLSAFVNNTRPEIKAF